MTTTDQNKLLDAGFTLIKPMNYPRPGKSTRFEIQQKTPERREWHENGWNYASPDERDKILRNKARNKMTILLETENKTEIITDFLLLVTVPVESTKALEFIEPVSDYSIKLWRCNHCGRIYDPLETECENEQFCCKACEHGY